MSEKLVEKSGILERKAIIKNADMTEDMQQDAIECATQALDKYNVEKDIAAYIKKEFDKKYNPTWHCIVGRNFGATGLSGNDHQPRIQNGKLARVRAITKALVVWISDTTNVFNVGDCTKTDFDVDVAGSYVTHETKHFVYFYLGQVAVLLFKSG
ncbi:hypothetical protein AXG93_374s1020 [Marchantia polymorpha subsp. ruderalis]|uniref:Dynein light chain n=1 Tax=Marchantia polymorpha subsp. ruderalis TaxID=1480154 RepID=A0A176WK95_MARPO|nr:hypothetical protein AXG93_374s1020 [Marchantia polymorpha subsp. ruderalis]